MFFEAVEREVHLAVWALKLTIIRTALLSKSFWESRVLVGVLGDSIGVSFFCSLFRFILYFLLVILVKCWSSSGSVSGRSELLGSLVYKEVGRGRLEARRQQSRRRSTVIFFRMSCGDADCVHHHPQLARRWCQNESARDLGKAFQ
jgi:hypothetical protein